MAMSSTLISTADLAARLGDPALVVVDVRHDLAQPDHLGEDRYRGSHLTGARFAHIDRDLSALKTGRNGRHPLPSPDAAAALFSRLCIGASKQVVAYDQGSGMFAARLWWMLRWLGHDAAAVLDGGLDQWVREGRPVTTEVPAPGNASFIVRRDSATLTADEVASSLETTGLTLVDARAPERFEGSNEPLDRTPGHIPGAVNLPFAGNLTADAIPVFRPADELRARFAAVGADRNLPIVYCGSGVTACHDLLALHAAGLRGRLYAGSWSEWSADPSLPIATGDKP